MVALTSLVVLSALAVSTLSLPRPDESAYRIPQVGTGRRSQYFVQHSDGTYKYGHDTGEGAFEEARSSRVGAQRGAFGYVDPEGRSVNLEYEAGEGGFVPRGAHLPQTHPDFEAAHAEARARPPFVDPLADSNTDASYGFQFAGEGQARTEESDSDGNVRGSYSYTDDEGRTRTYSYTAGRGIGFVVEGNDLPTTPEESQATPAATRLSSGARFTPSRVGTDYSATPGTIFRGTGISGASTSRRHGGSVTGSAIPSTASHTTSAFRHPSSAQGYSSFGSPSSSGVSGRPFAEANTRSQISPDGSYSFSYQTPTHSRAESGDRDNNVDGNFDFVADDGQRRAIQYEAGSDTGFIAEGAHIPVGPEVPGAPSGQPTGRIVPVREIPFVDPLANTNTDASYNFAFDSEQYSRSETADADGNVRGTYTIVDDDGTRNTYRFRAGEGVGFETEQVSTSRGAPPTRSSSSSSGVTSYSASHPSTFSSGAHSPTTRFSAGSSSTSASSSSFPSSSSRRFSSGAGAGFQLRQYDATTNPHKFGYVLNYDK